MSQVKLAKGHSYAVNLDDSDAYLSLLFPSTAICFNVIVKRMRIFDSPWVLYCTNAFSVLVWFTILFLIVTIWMASPNSMGKFKYYMLKMAVRFCAKYLSANILDI